MTTLLQGRRQQLPGTVLGPPPFARLESDRELVAAELSGALGNGAWSARGWGRREGLELHDALASAALGPTLADQTNVGTGGSIGWRGRPARGANLEVRVDGSGERFAPGVVEGAAPPPGATRGSAGAALDADWRAFDPVQNAVDADRRRDAHADVQVGRAFGHDQLQQI